MNAFTRIDKKFGSLMDNLTMIKCIKINSGIPQKVCASIQINVHSTTLAKNNLILTPINMGDLVNPNARWSISLL